MAQGKLAADRDAHRGASWLSNVILGGQDGLVNVLGVVLGVAAGTGNGSIVLVAGLAATFAESVSMAAVAYTSTVADADHYESERARELRHVEQFHDLERDEIRQIYAGKGFRGEALEQIVATITANRDVWVAVMMSEELGLSPVDRHQARRAAVVVGISAIVGSLIPLVPFFWFPVDVSMWLALAVAAVTLFGFGVYKAHATVGKPLRSGLELAIIGTLSALAGYVAGVVFRVPVVP